jgi:SAM-dependent methyltransferase
MSTTTTITMSSTVSQEDNTAKEILYEPKIVRLPTDILPPKLDVKDWLVESPSIGDWARQFYASYVGITDPTELSSHLIQIRSQAWEIYKYRCVASFLFVNYNLGEAYGWEWYNHILSRVKSGEKLLDLGCAFGHTARNLVYDGAPAENIISADLRAEFWELGYQLFKDRDTFHGQFHQGDVLETSFMETMDGEIDILHTSSFFHLFDFASQQRILRKILRLCSQKPGTVIFGRQVGNTNPCYLTHSIRPGKGLYMHSGESFKQMVGDIAGQDWEIQTWLTTRDKQDKQTEHGGKQGRLRFIITKVR